MVDVFCVLEFGQKEGFVLGPDYPEFARWVPGDLSVLAVCFLGAVDCVLICLIFQRLNNLTPNTAIIFAMTEMRDLLSQKLRHKIIKFPQPLLGNPKPLFPKIHYIFHKGETSPIVGDIESIGWVWFHGDIMNHVIVPAYGEGFSWDGYGVGMLLCVF